jgi:hypothetical protein
MTMKYPASNPHNNAPWDANDLSDSWERTKDKRKQTVAETIATVTQNRRNCCNPGNSLLLR